MRNSFLSLHKTQGCIIMLTAGLLLCQGCNIATASSNRIVIKQEFVDGYTLDAWADAIYLAEGGNKATYKYGIRSVHYGSEKEAREICKRTVRNNFKRYQKYGYKQYPQFIQFLESRFCPTKGRNLSKSERCLNGNWLRNVEFYLKRGY